MDRPPAPTCTGLTNEQTGPQGAARRRLLEAMPKAELHLHLDGSLRVDTALDLARSRGVEAPRTFSAMHAALTAPSVGASQAELLRAFDLPIALLQDAEALERVAAELVEAKAADRVRYVEIRWGPLLHLARGLPLRDGIAAVCRGAGAAARRTGIDVRLIATALRSHDPAANLALATAAAEYQAAGLTGFDLAGPEAAFPDPLIHRAAFAAAAAAGLRITLHAGEVGGPVQVQRALAVDPERIAHGPAAVDDLALCAELIRRGVALDLCPTSNVQAGSVPSRAAHPLAILHRRGVPVTLSTDDLTVSDITLSEEFAAALDEVGLRIDELWAINRRGLAVAFADGPTRARLTAEFDAWAATVPDVLGDAGPQPSPTEGSSSS